MIDRVKEMKKYKPVNEKVEMMLHGADYFLEQWLEYPEVLDEDIRLMKLAECNVMSFGMFVWSKLEQNECNFTFDRLDNNLNKFADSGIYTLLATQSGARPAWMSETYPEVLRVAENGVRNLHGACHKHCFTCTIYREITA